MKMCACAQLFFISYSHFIWILEMKWMDAMVVVVEGKIDMSSLQVLFPR